MADTDLKQKFPDLEPGRSPGALFRVNGIGFGMYGKRDEDKETASYVKTWCLSFLFIPILALRAYRVTDADRGWCFLGRVPLSRVARACNLLVLAGLLSLGGRIWWGAHASTDAYRAKGLVGDGKEAVARGDYGAAARAWKQAVQLSPGVTGEVVEGVRGILDREMPAADAAEVYGLAVFLQQQPQVSVAPDLAARGLAQAARCTAADPQGAVAIADAVAPLVPADQMAAVRRKLLGRIVEDDPDDLVAAVRLARDSEAHGDVDRCIALLDPHRSRLLGKEPADPGAASLGTRILGRAYAARGRYEDAIAVLAPFVQDRIAALRTAQQELDQAARRVSELELQRLQGGRAPEELERRIDAVQTEEQRRAIVTEYIDAKVAADPDVQRKRAAMQELLGVVPVTLELGRVRLLHSKAITDPAARKKELEEAEQAFLAIGPLAAGSDQYLLLLGQVRCGLGRTEEGRALFDRMLKARGRTPEALYQVAASLRELGAATEAREFAEEAYEKATDAGLKHQIAFLRAVTPKDVDDAIEWFGRADTSNPRVRASLAMSRGDRALGKGDEREASARYREALAALAEMGETASTFNEMAIAWQGVYAASGERPALDRAVAAMERALALEPASTILRVNAARLYLEAAAREIVGDADIETPRLRAGLATLGFLYSDEASRRSVVERYLAHPRCREATGLLESAFLMAPENAGVVTALVALRRLQRDGQALRGIAERIAGQRIDLGGAKEQTLATYRGEEVKAAREKTEHAIRRIEEGMDACRTKGSMTLAIAAATLAGLLVEAPAVGIETDLDEAVRLAAEADTAAPSAGTRSAVIHALLRRALRDLAAARPDEKERIEAAARILGAPEAFAYVLGKGGPAAEAVLALKDAQDAVALVARDQEAFPLAPGGWEWMVLKAAKPASASGVAKAIAADELTTVVEEIQLRLTPYLAETAYDAYWRRLAVGDEAAGAAILERCAAEGTPLPK